MGKHGQESAGAEDALRAAGGVARRGRGDRFSVGRKSEAGRCCMNTRCEWGGVTRTSLDPPQEPHYRDEVEGPSHV